MQRFLIEDHFGKIETGMVKDSGKFCTLINQVKNNIINSQFDNRSLAEWDAILISMNNDFPFEKPKQAELLNLVVGFSEKGLLNTAYDSYKKLPKNTNTSALLADVFVASCEISQKKSDFTYLERAINLFKINLKELQIPTASLKCKAFSPFSFVTTIEQEHREGYVKLLVKLGLNPNDDIDHKSITLTPLMIACMQSQLDSVKILVKYGADVNLGTSLVDGIKLMYHTPFSAAVGSRNLELVEFLLENNANPVKAGALYKELNPQLLPFASDIDFFPTIGIKPLSLEEDREHLKQVFHLIDKYYINKILLSIEQQESVEEGKIDASENKEDEPQTRLDTQKLLEDYIDFRQDPLVKKQEIQQEGKITLESQFDLLLLKFVNSGQAKDLQAIHEYIETNPELNLYDSTNILETMEYNQARQVLDNKRDILQRFFTSKKLSHTIDHSEKEVDSLKEIFEIRSSSLKHKVYVALSPELDSDERYSADIKNKMLAALESVTFIPANSKGKHGIKAYGGIIKLKCEKNLYIYAKEKYSEVLTGKTLIVFNKIGDHKEVDNYARLNKSLLTIKVKTLDTALYDHSIISKAEAQEFSSESNKLESVEKLLDLSSLKLSSAYYQYLQENGELILGGDMSIFDGIDVD